MIFDEDLYKICLYFMDENTKDPETYKRCMGIVKALIDKKYDSIFKSYIFKPIETSFYSQSPEMLHDYSKIHLEYFPLVNQRTF